MEALFLISGLLATGIIIWMLIAFIIYVRDELKKGK